MPEGFEKEVTNRIWLCGLLLIPALAAPIFAYYGFLMPDSELQGVWFQRSGSIAVIIAIFSELLLAKLNSYPGLQSSLKDIGNYGDPIWFHLFFYKLVYFTAGLIAVIGTIIWGYGDLLY